MVLQLLLGANFVDNYVFQFDYVNERMRLITRDSVNLKSIRNVDAKLDRSSGALLIRVGLTEDRNAWLQMDTGSNGGILIDRKLANSLEWPSTLPKVSGESYGINGSGEMEYYRVPKTKVGPFELENVLVSTPAPGVSTEIFETYATTGTRLASRKKSSGLLGYDVLKHFVVTIDYDRGHVHFYPGEKVEHE
jgi:predicted aspartyl protease